MYLYNKLYNYSLTSHYAQDVFGNHGHPVIFIISRVHKCAGKLHL